MNERGVTLVELLVSLALSAMTFMAAMQHMGTNLHMSSGLKQLSSIYDKAQHAMSILGSSVARAGYLGCGGRSADLLTLLRGDLRAVPELNLHEPYAIYRFVDGSSDWNPSLATLPVRVGSSSTNAVDDRHGIPFTQLVPGSDLLVVRGLGFAASVVAEPVASGSFVKVRSRRTLTRGSFAAITDCRSVEIFRITGFGTYSGLPVLRRGEGLGMHDNQATKLASSGAFSTLQGDQTKVSFRGPDPG